MSPPEKRKEESSSPPVAGERTWTICEECEHLSRDGEATCNGAWLNRRRHDPVEMVPVVELSRLRAAEEERDELAQSLRDVVDAGEWGRDVAREALASLEQKEG